MIPSDADILGLLTSLVQTVTVNPPGNEAAAARILADWLTAADVEARILPLGDGRANLVARVPGVRTAGGLALCGHLDTVPAGSAAWTHPPFGAEVVGGRMVGRGSADMKGGLAAAAAALAALRHSATPPPRDVLFLATAGEEAGNLGAIALADSGELQDVSALIIPEPTGLEVGIAHRGLAWIEVELPGRAAHGSMPHLGSNAILHALRFAEALHAHRFPVASHPLLGDPTVSVNQIESGIAVNVVPDRCRLAMDVRTVPGLDEHQVLETVEGLLDQILSSELRDRARVRTLLAHPPIDTPPEAEVVQVARRVFEETTGAPPALIGLSYVTDASVLVPGTDLSAILWGPGESAQAHQPDEFVEIERVLLATHLYAQAALRFGAPA